MPGVANGCNMLQMFKVYSTHRLQDWYGMGAVPVWAPRIAASAACMEGPSRSRAVAALGPTKLRSLVSSLFRTSVASGPDQDPRRERRWQQLFEIVDRNGNGRVEILGAKVLARGERRQTAYQSFFSLANFYSLCNGVEP